MMKKIKIDSYEYRTGVLKLPHFEGKLVDILMEFGLGIDPQGYDDGDYDRAIERIKKLIKQYHES